MQFVYACQNAFKWKNIVKIANLCWIIMILLQMIDFYYVRKR